MEENFLFLDSLGNYSSVPEGMVKNESGRGPTASGTKRETGESRNAGYNLFHPDRSDTSPDVIVKVEPEEESYLWGLNGHRAIPQISNIGFCVAGRRQEEVAPSRSGHKDGAPSQERERQRNVKFSEEENDILIKKISENYEKILGKLTTRTSTSEKKAIWRDIATSVNSVSAYSRTTMQCKKRYADIKKKVKEKMAKQSRHQSGSGPRGAVSFWPYEKYLMSLISCEAVLGIQKMADPGHMSDEDDIVSHVRPFCREIGNSSLSAQSLLTTEDDSPEMAEDSLLSGAEKVMTLSDGSLELEQDSQESQHDLHVSQGHTINSAAPSAVAPLPSVSDQDPQRDHLLFERSVHKKLNHLSACIKAQTSVLRQTNSILQNLSSSVQNGFQQLIHVIQQAVTIMSPDYQSTPQSSSHMAATPTPDTRGHNSASRGGHVRRGLHLHGRMSRGHCPYISSPPTKKSRGRS
ncbi:uncharacterized protein RCH25_044173 [Pelodytes ibericus]